MIDWKVARKLLILILNINLIYIKRIKIWKDLTMDIQIILMKNDKEIYYRNIFVAVSFYKLN